MRIERPESTVIVPVKGTKYVYTVSEKRYLKDKGYNVNKRVCVGKMEDETYMIPNAKFYQMFPELTEADVVPDCSDVLKVGLHVAIGHIMKSLELNVLLDDIYGRDGDMIKDVASYMIASEDSVMQHFPSYEYEHPLFMERAVEDTAVCEMLKRHTIAEHDAFLAGWNDLHKDVEGIYISYDSTNMNSAAEGIELLEYGHSKDGNAELPQVNVSIAFDQDHATPLFYEMYPGSIVDNSQCRIMVDKAKRYGYQRIGFILDRGYFSAENIRYFDKNAYEFLLMARGNALFIKEAIDTVRVSLRMNSKYYIAEHEVLGTTVKQKLFDDDKKRRYVHVFYDDVKGAEQRKSIMRRFALYDKELEKLTDRKLTRRFNVRKFEKYYRMRFYEDYLISFRRKEKEIEKELDYCGYFVIVTSEKMTAEEALTKYRNRDTTEKQFLAEKSFLGGDTWRVHSDESLESKQLTAFVALIVRNELFKSLETLRKKEKKRFTIPAALRELNRVIITRDRDGIFNMRYALTASQKNIYKSIGMTEEDVRGTAGEIAKRYSNRAFSYNSVES